jgi:DNA-binding transcriptional MerR regulator
MYSIADLESLTGISRRNIRFYVEQGLVPPPEGAGLGARYDEEHLARLRAIPVLRNRGLRLDDIRDRLADAKPRDLHELMTGPQPLPGEMRRRANRVTGRASMRYEIASGVEIVVDADLPPSMREKANALIEEAERIFGDGKGETR